MGEVMGDLFMMLWSLFMLGLMIYGFGWVLGLGMKAAGL
jgi:hypothetical protein